MKIFKNNVEIDISLDEFLELLEEDKLDELLDAFDQYEEEEEDERDKDFIPLDDFLKKDNKVEFIDIFKEIEDVFNTEFALSGALFGEMPFKKKSDYDGMYFKKEKEELSEEDKKVMRIVDRFKHI